MFGWWVEVEPLGVEAFTEGVLVDPSWGWWWCPGGRGSRPGRTKALAVGVGEDHGAVVGVARYAEQALVVHAVVVWAQGDEVPGVGGATVLPVHDVVHFQHMGLGAAGYPAVLVA